MKHHQLSAFRSTYRPRRTSAFLFLALLVAAARMRAQSDYATPYTFTTLAGLPPGSADGTGIAAGFNNPEDVAVDSAGNVYVADTNNCTIRKITAAGVVTTLAGKVAYPSNLDGTGSAANFAYPSGVAVDSAGTVYVADTNNNTIRKITPAGVVTTLAGSAAQSGSTNGRSSTARFNKPWGVAVDNAGNVYVVDSGNGTIRKITPAGVVTTLAGTAGQSGFADSTGSAAQFDAPSGVAVDNVGNVYVADTGNNTIRKITPMGVVTTLAGTAGQYGFADGTGGAAQFNNPRRVAVDNAGNVFVADSSNNAIREITPAGVVTTLAGAAFQTGSADGTGSAARFNNPWGVTLDSAGTVYVADSGNSTIRKITPAGAVTTLAGTAGRSDGYVDGTASAARFYGPKGVAVDGAGTVYVADTNNNAIRKITPTGVVTTLAGAGTGAQFDYPFGVAVDGAGNVYVADTLNDTIRKITPAGVVTTLAGAAGQIGSADGTGSAAQFYYPTGVVADSAGNVYVADSSNYTIRKITPAGVVTTLAGAAGQTGSAGGTGSFARFTYPEGVAADSAGYVFVADSVNYAIRKITPAGVVTTLAGAGQFGSADGTGIAARFGFPCGVAVDSAGNVYVADTFSYTIRKITPAGVVTTLAGAVDQIGRVDQIGSANGTGIAVQFNSPTGIAVDSAGNIYVADTGNNTIRKGSLTSVPTFTTQPMSQAAPAGGSLALSAMASSSLAPTSTYQWLLNGSILTGATSATLSLTDLEPANAGLYTAVATSGATSTTSDTTIVGVLTMDAVLGAGSVVGTNILHPNGNHFDQVLVTGPAESITADYADNRITRTSYIDLNDDIVQVEFSGAGTLSLVLDSPSGPALPVNYNQAVNYMKGHVGIVIAGADETTNVSVFTVGRATAVDPTGEYNLLLPISPANNPANNGSPLFQGHATTNYDGFADIAFIAILSTDGKFGGVRTANARYWATKGLTGLYAPGVAFQGPLFIGNIDAHDTAMPVIVIGSTSDSRITGGNLSQDNGSAVQVSGLTQLKFTDGSDSQGNALPAQANQAVLKDNGQNVTSLIVVNPP